MKSLKILQNLIFLASVLQTSANHFCSWDLNGEPKYFSCQRNEVCCHLGCCAHIAFQFYQLWYYWLLLIFLFMLCSGGSWWYKFCRQNESSNYPSASMMHQNGSNRYLYSSEHSRRRERRTPSRGVTGPHSLYTQRIWKANAPPPNYYRAAVVRYHSASDLESRTESYMAPATQSCPYYQLYGPPPSYESVVQMENRNGAPSCSLVPPPNMLITSLATLPEAAASAVVVLSPEPEPQTPRIFANSMHEDLQADHHVAYDLEPVPSTSQQSCCRASTLVQSGSDELSMSSMYSDSCLDLPSLVKVEEEEQELAIPDTISSDVTSKLE